MPSLGGRCRIFTFSEYLRSKLFTTLQYSTVQCRAEQCGSAQCSTEQSSTVQCSVLQCCTALIHDRASRQNESCSCRESGVAEGQKGSFVVAAGQSGWGPWSRTHASSSFFLESKQHPTHFMSCVEVLLQQVPYFLFLCLMSC